MKVIKSFDIILKELDVNYRQLYRSIKTRIRSDREFNRCKEQKKKDMQKQLVREELRTVSDIVTTLILFIVKTTLHLSIKEYDFLFETI